MKKILISILLVNLIYFTNNELKAQDVLLEQNVEKDTIVPKNGPNMKRYSHFYTGFGLVFGESEANGSAINYGKSLDYIVGYRFKYKINNFYAIGFDAKYSWTSFNIKQDNNMNLPVGYRYEREVLNFNNFGLIGYQRFNFGKRGNHIGNFLDLGAYSDWAFSVKQKYNIEFKESENSFNSDTQIINKGLRYVERLNYGVTARVGFGKYVVYGSYRLSNLFKPSFSAFNNLGELPRFVAGIQFSLHN
jgi:hypothetical protein